MRPPKFSSMSKRCYLRYIPFLVILLILLSFTQNVFPTGFAQKHSVAKNTRKGRLPVVIIPGLVGSELINRKTRKRVWFSITRSKDDDMRLPVSPAISSNRDDLEAGDILRSIKVSRFLPEIKIYKSLIASLEKDGYREGKIDDAASNGFEDTFYVFPYDWRRDNVENAHLLLRKLEGVRSKTGHPKLRFNIVAHSMGGLIARYAAMYGQKDLSERMAGPAWEGVEYFNNISLVGTPNGGSFLVLDSLLNGMSLSGTFRVNVPFVMDLTKFDVFTIPSIYQLLPHEGLLRVFDENLKSIDVDLYDIESWKKYGWLAYDDKEFADQFSKEEQEQAEEYFLAVLRRGMEFQAALNAGPNTNPLIRIFNFGAECKSTLDGMLVYEDPKSKKWKTLFVAESFKRGDGRTVSKQNVKELLFSSGDGQVSTASLNYSFVDKKNPVPIRNDFSIVCGHHSFLVEHEAVRKGIIDLFNSPPNSLAN